jgi:hypothetical protein
MEKHYVFIKNNKVANIAVFAEQDDELAQRIVEEQGHDAFIWFDEAPLPKPYATYNGSEFVDATLEELIALGAVVLAETPTE